MSDKPEPSTALGPLLDMCVANTYAIDGNRRGATVVELAILTLLIDGKPVTIEGAIRRIEEIHKTQPDKYHDDHTANRLKLITEWLRAHIAQPRGRWTPVVIEGGRK